MLVDSCPQLIRFADVDARISVVLDACQHIDPWPAKVVTSPGAGPVGSGEVKTATRPVRLFDDAQAKRRAVGQKDADCCSSHERTVPAWLTCWELAPRAASNVEQDGSRGGLPGPDKSRRRIRRSRCAHCSRSYGASTAPRRLGRFRPEALAAAHVTGTEARRPRDHDSPSRRAYLTLQTGRTRSPRARPNPSPR